MLDLGATAAALFFNLLLVSAFLAPTRTAVAGVVQEKELTLREGMRILGLQVGRCWVSGWVGARGGADIEGGHAHSGAAGGWGGWVMDSWVGGWGRRGN